MNKVGIRVAAAQLLAADEMTSLSGEGGRGVLIEDELSQLRPELPPMLPPGGRSARHHNRKGSKRDPRRVGKKKT